MEINIGIENINEIRNAFVKSPRIVSKHINIAIKKSLLIDLYNAKQKTTPVDTSNLIGVWDIKLSNLRGEYGPKSRYAYWVHQGSGPHWVGIRHIEGWAKRHGMNPYALQRSIAKKGTKANPFLQKAVDIARPSINNRFKVGLRDALNEIANMANK